MANVHVIYGHTGSWDEEIEWFVTAYPDELHAQNAVTLLNEWCKERNLHHTRPPRDNRNMARWDRTDKPPLDPEFHCNDDTGTEYAYFTIPLRTDPPATPQS